MHYNCLIVDDEVELSKMTCEYFQMFDVTCACVESAKDCEAFLKENTIDILLLDINLQEESGFVLCKKIREESDIPILFISARQSDDDVLIALNIGGDDYIKKPYTLSVLLAKVKIMMKRMGTSSKEKTTESAGNVRIESSTMKVYIGEKEVSLKAKEFKLFQCLFENRNTIVTKEKLFDLVWGDAYFSDGTLNVHIRKLREKLEENPNEPKMIKTIWGTGYMLEL
ncbi:MAG: response regulator transcription factor [Lachnospiraceae bacterium]|nr:response regulator transcription factor [Lachnospiraceae bacterium]